MLGLMRNVTSKISSDNAMPGWIVFFVEFFLYVSSDIFFNVVFFQSLKSGMT